MRTLPNALATALLLALPAATRADRTDFFAAAGLGVPELIRLELGYFVTPRVSVQAVAGLPVLAPLAGVGVSGWLLGDAGRGRPPKHSLLVSGCVRIRVDKPGHFHSGGDSLGAAAEVLAGYGLVTSSGFVLRAQAGTLLYSEHGLTGGPQVVVTAGYAF